MKGWGQIRKGLSEADSDAIRDEDEEPQADDGHGDVTGGDQGTAGHRRQCTGSRSG